VANNNKNSWFERNQKITLASVVLASVFIIDIFFANAYTVITGRSFWFSSSWAEMTAEKAYRKSSDLYHHTLRKNKSVDNAVSGGIRYKVFTNSLGFRDKIIREVPLVSDKYRVVLLGDSFVEGVGVDYEDSFVGLVDQELSKQHIEVLNAAVVSYSPSIYWRKVKYLLEDVGLKFDSLIVFLDISDIEDEAVYYYETDSGNIALRNIKNKSFGDKLNNVDYNKHPFAGAFRKFGRQLKVFIKTNTIATYFFAFKINDLMRFKSGPKTSLAVNYIRSLWTVEESFYESYGKKGLEKMAMYMNKLHILLKNRDIKLTLVVYPWPDQIMHYDTPSIQETFWMDWCGQRNIPLIDCFPYFIGKEQKDSYESRRKVCYKYFLANNVHWNRQGHRLIAHIILRSRNNF